MRGKLSKLFVALCLLIPMFAGAASVAHADYGTFDLIVHKLIFEEGKLPETQDFINNEGAQLDAGDISGLGATTLNGVSFKLYDITEEYHRRRTAEPNKTVKELQGEIQGENKTSLQAYAKNVDSYPDPVMTAGNGEARFVGLPRKITVGGVERDAAYMLIETNQPANVSQIAHPVVIIMPTYNSDGKLVTKIHVYPKNEEFEEEIDKTADFTGADHEIIIDEGGTSMAGQNVQVGQVIPYTIRVGVPNNLDLREYLRVTDSPDVGLELVGNVSVEDMTGNQILTAPTDFQVVTGTPERGFTLTFFDKRGGTPAAPSSELKKYEGKYVYIRYNMIVTEDAVPDTWISNDATRLTTHNKVEDKKEDEGPKLRTGGINFVKVDAQNNDKLLNGAEFQLVIIDKQSKDILEYAKAPNANGKIEFSSNVNDAHIFTPVNGKLTIKELLYSEMLDPTVSYALIETKAPDGYVLDGDTRWEFEITNNEYTITLKDPAKIANTQKGVLPSTGGAGIIAFLVVGTIMMVVAIVKYRRLKSVEV